MDPPRHSPPSHTPIFRDRMRSLAEQLQAHDVLLPMAPNVFHLRHDTNQEMPPNMAAPPPPRRPPLPPLDTRERKQELLVAPYLGDDYGDHGELPVAREVTEVVPHAADQEMVQKIAAAIKYFGDENYKYKDFGDIHNDLDHGGRRKKKRRKRKAESRKRKSRKRKSRKRKSRKRKSRKRKANRRTKRKH